MSGVDEQEFAVAQQAVSAATEGRIELVEPISRGAFGLVARAECVDKGGGDTEKQDVAIKCLKLGPNDNPKEIAREVSNHMKLLHAHVVRFREAFAAPPFLCIAMDLVSGGDLLDLINASRGLSEDEARYIFQQLILAVDYCHRMGVMNRDIKPENTLLLRTPGRPPMLKLCDFGYAKSLEDSAPTTRAGTMHYVAPEVLLSQQGAAYDGMKADVWSCGVLLYVTLFCTFPFEPETERGGPVDEGAHMREMIRRMTRSEFGFPANRPVSPECQDLLRHMLDHDHTRRYLVADIKRHPWFLKNLLPGSLEYNDKVLAVPRMMPQSDEEVWRAIELSRAVPQTSQSTLEGYDALQSDEDEML